MTEIKLLSWNVNGLRAVSRHGFLDWLRRENPDVLCLQETKTVPGDLPPELKAPVGYTAFWNNPLKKGYAGVATFCREPPLRALKDIENPGVDTEGRILITEHRGFTLYNVYFPNGKKNEIRLKYKLDFYNAVLDDLEKRRRKGEKIIVCGDINTAHREIDLARPRENSKISGFLPVERAWLDKITAMGYIDIFRALHPEPGHYTFWDVKTRARERNIGWRIDMFLITPNVRPLAIAAGIHKEVTGSDHCPISLILKISS